MNLRRNISLLCFCMFLMQICFASYIDTVQVGEKGAMYSVSEALGSSYYWEVEGGSIAAGNGTAKIIVDWGDKAGEFEISVIETNLLGCSADPVKAKVLIKTSLVLTLDNYLEFCEGSKIAFTSLENSFYLLPSGKLTRTVSFTAMSDTLFPVVHFYNGVVLDTTYDIIRVFKRPVAGFTIYPDNPKAGEELHLKYNNNGANYFQWYFDEADTVLTGEQAVSYAYQAAGIKTIRLVVSNKAGCTDTIVKRVEVFQKLTVMVPDAFSPNGDGINDKLIPHVMNEVQISSCEMKVYDRWGKLIHTGRDINNLWDGNAGNSSAPQGTYVYLLAIHAAGSQQFNYSGTIALHR